MNYFGYIVAIILIHFPLCYNVASQAPSLASQYLRSHHKEWLKQSSRFFSAACVPGKVATATELGAQAGTPTPHHQLMSHYMAPSLLRDSPDLLFLGKRNILENLLNTTRVVL